MKPLLIPDLTGNLSLWDEPRDSSNYVVGADVAEGKKRDLVMSKKRGALSYANERPDYSAAVVIDLDTADHVATWHGYLPPDKFATVIAAIGLYFNTALVVPELNGPGIAVVSTLSETLNYSNIYRSRIFNVLDGDALQDSLGFRTDEITRKLLIQRVHEVVNQDRQWTRDRRLIGELRTMEFDDQGKERARGRNKDDCVFALALALQGRYTAIGNKFLHVKDPLRGRPLDRRAWEQVRKRQEAKRGDRATGPGGRLFARWSRGPWSGRDRGPS